MSFLIVIISILFLTVSCTTSNKRSPSSIVENPLVFLDTHYHFDIHRPGGNTFQNEYQKLQEFTDKGSQKTFLISGGYDDPEYIQQSVIDVVEAVEKDPENFIGICGINLLNIKNNLNLAIEKSKYCLAKKEMRGIKLHFWANGICLGKDNSLGPLLVKYIEAISSYNPFFLIHVNNAGPEFYEDSCVEKKSNLKGYLAETKELYKVTSKFPKLYFILAHARADLDYLSNQKNISNIYLELSTTTNIFRDRLPLYRLFGLDKVLFGSDNIPFYQHQESSYTRLHPNEERYTLIDAMLDSTLTTDELSSILYKNGQNFFNKIKQ